MSRAEWRHHPAVQGLHGAGYEGGAHGGGSSGRWDCPGGGATAHSGAGGGGRGLCRWPLQRPILGPTLEGATRWLLPLALYPSSTRSRSLSLSSLTLTGLVRASGLTVAVGGSMARGPYRGLGSVSGLGGGLWFFVFKIYFRRRATDRLQKY